MSHVDMVPLGRMRHRVTIQTLAATTDAGGGQSETWTDVKTVWASIKPTGGGEKYKGHQLQENTTHVVEMRHRTDVTPAETLVHEGRRFSIRRVLNPKELDVMLIIEAVEMKPDEGP